MRRGKTRTLVGMDERRSALEWILDTLAAIGLMVAVVSWVFRDRYPVILDLEALVYTAVGVGLLVGGVAGSKWCKQRRMSALIDGSERSEGNAN
jgi:hypothetical protein